MMVALQSVAASKIGWTTGKLILRLKHIKGSGKLLTTDTLKGGVKIPEFTIVLCAFKVTDAV